jgi:hypothetical protein
LHCQRRSAGGALVAMDHLEDAPWLTDTLGSLGEKRVGHGAIVSLMMWRELLHGAGRLCSARHRSPVR